MRWWPASRSRRLGRWVLIVRAGGVRLYRGSRRALAPAEGFAADETGYAGLRRALERGPPRVVRLLVDLVEEDFRRETAPHVIGRGRRAVLATRSARLFPGAPYVSARREGRAPEGRRDDRVLVSAVVRPERLRPWLEALHGYEVAGVHSLPLVSARLPPLLGAEAGPVLLVTASGGGDLRQTFFEDGRLTLSRLAPLPAGNPGDRARRIVAEVERLLQHLDRSGHSLEGLRVRLVADAGLLAAVREAEGPRELSEGLVDALDLERRLGGRAGRRSRVRAGAEAGTGTGEGPDPEDGCDRTFALLALRRRLPDHYAPAETLVPRRTRQAGRALQAAGLAALLAGLAWSGAAWRRADDLAAAEAAAARQAEGYEARYRAERRAPSEVAPDDLRLAVETAQRLDAGRVGALPVLRAVSEALAGAPDLRLESLEWFEPSERDGWPDAPEEPASRERFRVVLLRGRVEPFDGHYRAAADEVFRFADGLGADPRWREVEVTDLPREPVGGGRRHGPEPGFALRMVLDVRGD